MKNWVKYRLNEVCKIGDGNHSSNYPKSNEMVSEGIPFIRANNMVNGEVVWNEMKFITPQKHAILKKGHLKTGDILFTNRGEIGKIAIVGSDFENANLNSQIAWFRCLEIINNRFLFYFLASPSMKNYYSVEKNGAALQQFTIRQINDIEIPLPPLPEQQRIVSILDECFAAIAKAKANAEQNLKNAAALFESYLQGVFEKKRDGWEEKKLGEVCEYDKNQNVHKGLPYVGLEHIESNSGRFLGSIEPQEVKSSTFHFDEQHVLYGRLRPYLNKVLLLDFEGHCSTEIFPIKPNKQVAREFLFYWLIAGSTVKKIDATWTGARMPRANMNQVLEFVFAFPSLKEQQTIVRDLDALRTETQKLEAVYQNKINDLEELKKAILQKAFAGELRSPEGVASAIDGHSPSKKKSPERV